MEKLKPCPFCGKTPKIVEEKIYTEYHGTKYNLEFFLSCCNNIAMCGKDKEVLIKRWNTRYSDARIKELEEMIQRVREFGVEEIEEKINYVSNDCDYVVAFSEKDVERCSQEIHAALQERIDGNKTKEEV